MTTLEIFLIIILWVIIGVFICYKRDWYDSYDMQNDSPSPTIAITFAIVFMPFNFLIVFIRRIILEPWDNSKI